VRVKWNRTGSVGRVFFRRGRTRKIAENGGSDGRGEFSTTNDTNAGRWVVGFGEPRKTRKTRKRKFSGVSRVQWSVKFPLEGRGSCRAAGMCMPAPNRRLLVPEGAWASCWWCRGFSPRRTRRDTEKREGMGAEFSEPRKTRKTRKEGFWVNGVRWTVVSGPWSVVSGIFLPRKATENRMGAGCGWDISTTNHTNDDRWRFETFFHLLTRKPQTGAWHQSGVESRVGR
jgi:hypothetical protein